ncbi:hypothetical protein [Cognatiluteimonas profundi]|uniref:hypothetical protein n=1 Tax=Cognatiluteimonas profundi TaxID=2594501 RepID=UPI00131C8C88|nr:hypothetical protein [Lysobacter profundi]
MKTLATHCAIALMIASVPMAWAQDADKKAAQPEAQAQDTTAAKEEKSPVDAVRDYSVERRSEAVAAARRATDELDTQMERLQTQTSEGWSRMSTATRERSRKEMADLQARRNTLAEWVGGMKHGSAGAWTEVKTGFGKSYDELASALRKARAEFRQAPAEKPAPTPEKPADKKGG